MWSDSRTSLEDFRAGIAHLHITVRNTLIEQQESEDFVRQCTDLMSQVLPREVGTFEHWSAAPEAL
jgi:hypothetical protein